MKRVLFYVILILQVMIIAALGLQYYFIDDYGITVKLLREDQDLADYPSYEFDHDVHLNYEINSISKGDWDVPKSIDHNEKVYVLLELGDDGIHHVIHASDKKINAMTDQVVFVGNYQYFDAMSGENEINYGFERAVHHKEISKLNPNKRWVITLKVAPWGQKKIVAIEDSE